MVSYYFREIRWLEQVGGEFWRVDDDVAQVLGRTDSTKMSTHYRDPDEDMMTTLRKRIPSGTWHKLSFAPGEYYPRMARPDGINKRSPGYNPDTDPAYQHSRARSTGQLHAFIQGELSG